MSEKLSKINKIVSDCKNKPKKYLNLNIKK